MDEELEASPVVRRTPWPIGLYSVEERRKKEEEERVREPQQQLQEEQQQPRREGGEEETLEDALEQCRQQELLELQQQQQQWSQQLEEQLELPPHGPSTGGLNRHRRGGPTPGRRVCQFTALRPLRGSAQGLLRSSRPSQGEQTVWWRLPAPCAPPWTPSQRLRPRFMVSRESLLDFFESDDRGRNPTPTRRTKPGRRAVVIPARPGPGGQ